MLATANEQLCVDSVTFIFIIYVFSVHVKPQCFILVSHAESFCAKC